MISSRIVLNGVGIFVAITLSVIVFAEDENKAEAIFPSVVIPVVLPEKLVKGWLEKDPEMNAANSAFEAAKVEAEQIAASPYEWNASFTKQQRDYGTGSKSDEWNVGIERTFRLPGKYSADKTTARAKKALACAGSRIDKRAAASHLLGDYLDWRAAHAGKALLAEQQQLAQRSFDAVAKRVKSGDASMLEQKLASAELLDIQRQASEADVAEATTWAQFSSRYPTDIASMPDLPDPAAIVQDADWWQARITTMSDQLLASRSQYQAAQAGADRAQSDRLPDPTIGVFTGTEAYGDEKVVGVSISMPIPGGRRSQEQKKQLAESNRAYQNMILAERQLNSDARSNYVNAIGNYQRWQLSQNTLLALRDNANLGQRAYALGEQDLQGLLLAQRQGLAAAQAEVEARVAALRSYYNLLLAAKMLWPDVLDAKPADC